MVIQFSYNFCSFNSLYKWTVSKVQFTFIKNVALFLPKNLPKAIPKDGHVKSICSNRENQDRLQEVGAGLSSQAPSRVLSLNSAISHVTTEGRGSWLAPIGLALWHIVLADFQIRDMPHAMEKNIKERCDGKMGKRTWNTIMQQIMHNGVQGWLSTFHENSGML